MHLCDWRPAPVPCSNELALLYNDLSPLENHHLATSFKVLQRKDCNFLKRMPKDKQVGRCPHC